MIGWSMKMYLNLYKHKNNTDVAVEVVRMIKIPGKNYARIKVRWWNIGKCHAPWNLGLETQWLTDATIRGNKDQRMKYPISKWKNDWEIYKWK